MEAQAALVGADGAVELYAVAYVDVYLAFVVSPWYPERDNALWLDKPLYQFCLFKFWMFLPLWCRGPD